MLIYLLVSYIGILLQLLWHFPISNSQRMNHDISENCFFNLHWKSHQWTGLSFLQNSGSDSIPKLNDSASGKDIEIEYDTSLAPSQVWVFPLTSHPYYLSDLK